MENRRRQKWKFLVHANEPIDTHGNVFNRTVIVDVWGSVEKFEHMTRMCSTPKEAHKTCTHRAYSM